MQKKQIIKTGKEVIDLEIKALQKLKQYISTSFTDAVSAISNCSSKVILCEIGRAFL